jgi:hypothetical protein
MVSGGESLSIKTATVFIGKVSVEPCFLASAIVVDGQRLIRQSIVWQKLFFSKVPTDNLSLRSFLRWLRTRFKLWLAQRLFAGRSKSCRTSLRSLGRITRFGARFLFLTPGSPHVHFLSKDTAISLQQWRLLRSRTIFVRPKGLGSRRNQPPPVMQEKKRLLMEHHKTCNMSEFLVATIFHPTLE